MQNTPWRNQITGLFAMLVLLSLVLPLTGAPAYVWIEGEDYAKANFKPKSWDGTGLLSGGQWITHTLNKGQVRTGVPADGFQLRYSFQTPENGTYDFWARVGYEHVRAPLEWRVDTAPWQTVGPEVHTTSLMEVSPWCEVAWLKAGAVPLTAGRHALELRYSEPGPDGRLLIGLDCLAFAKGKFVPEGALKPGGKYDTEIDRQAKAHVFRFNIEPGGTAQRVELPLDGLWQAARFDDPDMDQGPYAPIKSLPTPAEYPLRWMGFTTPNNAWVRPELQMGHRLFFRTRIAVPKELKGRAFHLHFSGTCWIASVFVNSQFVGAHQSVLVPWDLDVTRAVRPGKINTLVVGIKSGWYAADPKANRKPIDETRNVPLTHARHIKYVAAIYPSTKGEGSGLSVGLVNPVTLVATGPVYTAGVVIRTSVAGKRLDAEVSLKNSTAQPATMTVRCEAVNRQSGRVERTFGPVQANVPANGVAVASLTGPWTDPKLWWPAKSPGDRPALYTLRTTVAANEPSDIQEETFGFREVSVRGKDFLLNGIPWHFWNWVSVGKAHSPDEWLKLYHVGNNRFHRFSYDSDRLWGDREKALAFFDRHGIPGRLSTCADGMFITHDLTNPRVWRNFENHVRQVVQAYRNHPSIMMWSLGNEVMLITARLAGWRHYREAEEEAAHLSEIAKKLDPTRFSFQDGGGDLGGLIEANCQHYSWKRGTGFPQAAYRYELLPDGKPFMPRPRDRDKLYMWDGHKPLILGEVWYYADNPERVVWFGGPAVYRDMQSADRAAADYSRIAVEGARWQGVTAICPWVGALYDAAKSFAPRAVFVREYNSVFRPGSTVNRTIRVFNDGHSPAPLTLKWRLMIEGQAADRGEKVYAVPPGEFKQDVLQMHTPRVTQMQQGRLVLELYAAATRVFGDSKPVKILPIPTQAVRGLSRSTLSVFDPNGSVRHWLDGRGIGYTSLGSPLNVPGTAKVLLVGADALTKQNKPQVARALARFVLDGKTCVVLEQKEPLEGKDLPVAGVKVAGPAKRGPRMAEFRLAGGHSGAICFPVAPAHRVLRGLAAGDFFTWAGDETNFRLSYATPGTGVISIIQAGDGLGLTPVMEVPVGQGSYLLSQMTVGEKIAIEPVAEHLLCNMLGWAANRAGKKPARTLLFAAGSKGLEQFIGSTNALCQSVPTVDRVLDGDAAIVNATPHALSWLLANRARLNAFCERGGWLMLIGLGPKGLPAFNRIVGFPHRLRKFETEAVRLVAPSDPLMLGLTDRDWTMTSDKMIASWMRKYWVSDRVFTNVVDGAEIASFGGNSDAIRKVTNGLTNEDFWRYIHYVNGDGETIEFDFGRPEAISGIRIKPTAAPYFRLKDVDIVFDGDSKDPVHFTCQEIPGLQDIPIRPRKAAKVTFKLKDHWPGSSGKNLMGVDLIEITRNPPAIAQDRVVPLTHPAGLVNYPLGKGGIVLNQLDWTEDPKAPGLDRRGRSRIEANVVKKRAIYANLLRNMEVGFRVSSPALSAK